MNKGKTIIHFSGNATGSFIGENNNITLTNNISKGTDTRLNEDKVQEVVENYLSYLGQIDRLAVTNEAKKEAKQAVLAIQQELTEENPDIEVIQTCSDTLKKSSEIASICGAVFGLLQLF